MTARLAGHSVKITQHIADVSNRRLVAALPDEIIGLHNHVDIIVNNAGVALSGSFGQIKEADFDWLLGIKLGGTINVTRTFLPLLRERPIRQIFNLSSISGIVAVPNNSAYVTSKFAVRGFSEALRQELVSERSPVGVTVVHPGGVRTAIVDSARVAASLSEHERERAYAASTRSLRKTAERAGGLCQTNGIGQTTGSFAIR